MIQAETRLIISFLILIIECNLLIPDNICLTLSDAINRGDQELASNLARQLATQKAVVKIRLDDPENDELTRGAKDNTIKFVFQVPLHLTVVNKNIVYA